MVSKKNIKNKMVADSRRIPHYGIRKLSIGVASVLLSTTLYFGISAHAATVSTSTEPTSSTQVTNQNQTQQLTIKGERTNSESSTTNAQLTEQPQPTVVAVSNQNGQQENTGIAPRSVTRIDPNNLPAGWASNGSDQDIRYYNVSYNAYKLAYENGTLPPLASGQPSYPDPSSHVIKASAGFIANMNYPAAYRNKDNYPETINDTKTGYKFVELTEYADGTCEWGVGPVFLDSPDADDYVRDHSGMTTVDPLRIPTIPAYTTTVTLDGNVVATTNPQGQATVKNESVWEQMNAQQYIPYGDSGVSTLDVTYTPITITVTHDQPKTSTDPLPDNPEKKYPNGLSQNDLNQTITRTINIQAPAGHPAITPITQTARIFRDATVNEATGEVTYGDWSTDNTGWKEVVVPSIAGYTANQTKIDAVTVGKDQTNQTINISYKANPQTMQIIFQDGNGQVLRSDEVHGVTDQQVPYTGQVPVGWKLAAGQSVPRSVTFAAAGNPDIKITVEHATITVTPAEPKTPSDTLPDNPEKKYPSGVSESDLNKTVTRTVTIAEPGKSPATQTQSITFTRTATVDEVTGQVTYGDWSENGQHEFAAITVPPIAGYTASGAVPAVTVTPTTDSSTVKIAYTANQQSGQIVYKDSEGKQIGTTALSGRTGDSVAITPQVPVGWKISAGQQIPERETATATGFPEVDVTVEHATTTVIPTNPKTPSDSLPDNPEKKYPSGVSESDLNKTVTRTITITEPNQAPTTQTQKATFTRTATVDEVTGKVTYGQWSENGQHEFAVVPVPPVAGYTPSGAVPAETVTPETASSTVDVTYRANDQTTHIIYEGKDGQPVHTTTVKGKTDQTVDVPSEIPDGWVTIPDYQVPSQITFTGASTDNVVVPISHGHITVQPGQSVEPGSVIPGTTDKHFPDGLTHNDLNKTLHRTIVINEPNGRRQVIRQTLHFSRTADVDTVNQQVTYGDWRLIQTTNDGFDEVLIPQFAGYRSSVDKLPAEQVSPDEVDSWQDQTINVTYQALPQQTSLTGAVSQQTVIESASEQPVKQATRTLNNNQSTLPQTGDAQQKLAIVGLLTLGLAFLLSLVDHKKRD
ncbi:Gram-positive signal peptide protein, YSIRK family [Limosilactobacillus antri DSM 16041]|uniref:Gram-positive signal peptide protein, YSIRK family n=2 Tax=Limosilactobacillus antri TaxID=227943 RepID=C8P7K7_9LACO|nr:Gram-positive signal peptide protein, YSIRK family [Limosilactobacillus antri DSM 16041]KRK56673.1 hypothetical protein FC31_GL001253 [Limosilactobacillus antri DSM 16041]